MAFHQARFQCEGTTRTGQRCRRGVAHPMDWCGWCRGLLTKQAHGRHGQQRSGDGTVEVLVMPGLEIPAPTERLLTIDEYCALHPGVASAGLDVMVPVPGTDLMYELFPGKLDEQSLRFYATERSLDLAIALYDLTGWPVFVRTDPGRMDSPGFVAEAAAMCRPGTYLGIDGEGDMDDDQDWERLSTEMFNQLLADPHWGDINLPIARQYALTMAG